MKFKNAGITLAATAVAGFIGLSFGSAKPVYVPSYRAVRVIDGDTFETAEKQWIRVSGIDAPEQDMCGSREAKQELEKLVLGKDIYLKVMYHDSTRLMALVYSKDGFIATKMLASGWAELNDRDGLGLPELSQADKLLNSTANIIGNIQGEIGQGTFQIKGLELLELESGKDK